MKIEAKGFWSIAPHNHSSRGDGKFPFGEILTRASVTGIDGCAITDHDINPKLSESKCVIFGKEITSVQGHVLVYAQDRKSLCYLSMIGMGNTLYEITRYAHKHDLMVVIPHIGRGISPGSVSPETIDDLYRQGERVDGVEVKHPYFKERHYRQAERIAERYGISQLGASDNHSCEPGNCFVTFVPKRSDSPRDDFFEALKNKTTVPANSGIISEEAWQKRSLPENMLIALWHGREKLPYWQTFLSRFLRLRFRELGLTANNIYGD